MLPACQSVKDWYDLYFVVPKNPFIDTQPLQGYKPGDPIPWRDHRPGDPMPCPPKTRVLIRFASGHVSSFPYPAYGFGWGDFPDDPDAERIVAWRPVP